MFEKLNVEIKDVSSVSMFFFFSLNSKRLQLLCDKIRNVCI